MKCGCEGARSPGSRQYDRPLTALISEPDRPTSRVEHPNRGKLEEAILEADSGTAAVIDGRANAATRKELIGRARALLPTIAGRKRIGSGVCQPGRPMRRPPSWNRKRCSGVKRMPSSVPARYDETPSTIAIRSSSPP